MERSAFRAHITILVFSRHDKVNGSVLVRELFTESEKGHICAINQSINYTNITISILFCKPEVDSSVKNFISQELAQELLTYINNLSEEEIDEIEKHNESTLNDFLQNIDIFINESIKDLQKQSLISSFGDNPCDASMWAYYAEEHKGYVLEYKVTSPTFDFCAVCQKADTEYCDGTPVRARLYPIVYSDKRYDATEWVDSRIGTTSLRIGFGETNDYYPDILTFDKSCLIKGKQWSHENEWRIVCYPVHTPKTSAPIAVHTHTPSAIYYGAKIADEDYRILHNTIEKLRDYGAEIAEYIMVIDSDSDNFSMKTKLISDK